MPIAYYDWHLKALTQIWTGDADTAHSRRADRFIPTGLLGSVRWWFEVVVRGLGGSACDHDPKAPPKLQCPDPSIKDSRQPRHHCVVCDLFGCTGWARKFRMLVFDQDGKPQSKAIQKDDTFSLRLVPLRPICPEEWALLDTTLRLIAEYGALGGKTVYKPSDEANRQNRSHHRDYGLVQLNQAPAIEHTPLGQLRAYAAMDGWRKPNQGNVVWSSLENFWCVKDRYLARQNGNQSTFNRAIGRPESKSRAGQNDSWLAGRRAGQGRDPESKKLFSFKKPKRTFGFVQPGTITLDQVKQKLNSAWPDFNDAELWTGTSVLHDLITAGDE